MAKKKTLEDAIGCWTTRPEALRGRLDLVRFSVNNCKSFTEKGHPPERLRDELELLVKRIDSLKDIAVAAFHRCNEIIETKEVQS